MPARTDRDAREGNHEPIETSAATADDDTLPSRRTAPGPRGAKRTLSPLLATPPRLTRYTLLPLLSPVSQDGRAPPGRGVQGEDASRVQDGRDDEGPRAAVAASRRPTRRGRALALGLLRVRLLLPRAGGELRAQGEPRGVARRGTPREVAKVDDDSETRAKARRRGGFRAAAVRSRRRRDVPAARAA